MKKSDFLLSKMTSKTVNFSFPKTLKVSLNFLLVFLYQKFCFPVKILDCYLGQLDQNYCSWDFSFKLHFEQVVLGIVGVKRLL